MIVKIQKDERIVRRSEEEVETLHFFYEFLSISFYFNPLINCTVSHTL